MSHSTSARFPNWRIGVLIVVAVSLLGALSARLGYLQIFQHGHYMQIAEAQRKRASELAPHRGTIYLTEGSSGDIFPVASNTKGWIVYAVPRDMKDFNGTAEQLAPELYAYRQRADKLRQNIIEKTGQNLLDDKKKQEEQNNPPATEDNSEPNAQPTPSPSPEVKTDEEKIRDLTDELKTKFDKRTDPYEPILRPYEILDDQLLAFLQEKNFPGLVLEEKEVRTYPEDSLAAHIIGYLGFNGDQQIGRYGIEGYFDKILRGNLGWFSAEKNAQGDFIGVANNEFKPAQDGSDVVLTVDRVVQSYAEEILAAGVQKYGAERGSIIVMDPKTSAVLGMATFPTFDPNAYYAVKDARVQTNPLVSDIFEPGSILKPVIMAGAINDGIVTPNTTFVDSGPVKIGKYTINTFNGKHLGVQTMTQILEQSNNVGMVWVGEKVGAQTEYDYLRRFGLGERTGIELEGETQTNLQEPDKWSEVQLATTSFGQGVALTPLQALNAINAIANKGVLMQPHIVSSIRQSDGTVKKTEPKSVRQVVTAETADKVSAMMVSVIENGVGRAARVPGYYIAGKTGTAQVPDARGKYSTDKKIISFVGFGPIENPKFSVLIKLDNPAGLSFASGTAAPMFKQIAEKLLNYYQIPPSYDKTVSQPKFIVSN